MIKISNYSLNYPRLLAKGELTIFGFLALCRQLGVEGASLHVQNLPDISTSYLKQIRRAYLENGLAVSMATVSTNFGNPREGEKREFEKALEAIRVATFVGAPLLRVFPGSPKNEADRPQAFERAAAAFRKVCEEGVETGLAIGLQHHNHLHLCRTGADVIRFVKLVNHPNLTFVLDTGQFAGSRGASGAAPPELRNTDFMESIRMTASLARHVRMKFYNPRPDGSEPWIDYDKIFDILRGVHYGGFVDIVYEPGTGKGDPGEDVRTAVPRVVKFLRSKILSA